MSNTTTIGCNCGELKVEVSGDPVAQFYCHCDDCQAVHGAAYIPIIMFPADSVRVLAGARAVYALRNNPRLSCPSCGTKMFAEPPGMGVKGVVANRFPPGTFKPQFHIQCQHAVLPIKDELPHFKGYPQAFGGSDETIGW